LLVFIKKVKM